jgi:hypothetical protein
MKLIRLGFLVVLLVLQTQGSDDESIHILMFKQWFQDEANQLNIKVDNYGKSLQIVTENFKKFVFATVSKPLSDRLRQINNFHKKLNSNHDGFQLSKKLDSLVDQFDGLQKKFFPDYRDSYRSAISQIGSHSLEVLVELKNVAPAESSWNFCIQKFKSEFLGILSRALKAMENCVQVTSGNINVLKTTTANNVVSFTTFAQNTLNPLEKCLIKRDASCVDDVVS